MEPSEHPLRHDPWLAHPVRIEKVVDDSDDVRTYTMSFVDAAQAATYSFQPGQFNMLYLPGVGEAAISLSGDPADPGRLVHTVRQVGNVTGALAQLEVGQTLGLRGPFGSHWPVDACRGQDVILVAGGIGLPPLRPALLQILAERDAFGDVTLLYGARNPDGLLYPEQRREWSRQGLRIETTVDRADNNWKGHVGVVTLLLDRLTLPRPEQTQLLTVGPEVMMWYTVQTAIGRGIPAGNIWVSMERNMNCAIGLCGHCQFGPEFICKDGPVFPFPRISSILKVDEL